MLTFLIESKEVAFRLTEDLLLKSSLYPESTYTEIFTTGFYFYVDIGKHFFSSFQINVQNI